MQVGSENSPVLRLRFIDALRGCAILFVILHHAWLTIWPSSYPSGWVLSLTGWLYFGRFGVDVFMVLSGFSLMYSVLRNHGELRGGAFGFYKKRLRRLLIPFYFALLFSLILIFFLIGKKTGTHWDITIPVTWKGFMINVFLLHDIFRTTQINATFWFMAVALKVYVFFPLLIFSWRKAGALITAFLAFAYSFIVFILTKSFWFDGVVPLYFMLFVLGMLAATVGRDHNEKIWESIIKKIPWGLCAVLSFFLVFILSKEWGFAGFASHRELLDFLVGLFSFFLLACARQSKFDILQKAFVWSPLIFIGTFSYSIYLIHTPLLQVVWQLIHPFGLGTAGEFLLLIIFGLPSVFLFSYVFYMFCEKPFLKKVA